MPPHAPVTAWLLGLITTAGLFLSVFGHELAHALMAKAEGIEIEEIVLHPFGGLARLKTDPQNPRAEFRIASGRASLKLLVCHPRFCWQQTSRQWGTTNQLLSSFS